MVNESGNPGQLTAQSPDTGAHKGGNHGQLTSWELFARCTIFCTLLGHHVPPPLAKTPLAFSSFAIAVEFGRHGASGAFRK